MFLLLVELNAKPSAAAELENILSELADVAREEAGNVIYGIHRQQDNPNAFVLYELYKDRAAWEAHLTIGAVQGAMQQFGTLLTTPARVVCCDTIVLSGIDLPAARCNPHLCHA